MAGTEWLQGEKQHLLFIRMAEVFRGKKFSSYGDDDCAHVWFKFHSTYFVICQKSNGNLKVQPERKTRTESQISLIYIFLAKTTSKSERGG